MLIIGGTGTIGKEVTRIAYEDMDNRHWGNKFALEVLSRDDTKQARLWEELGRADEITWTIGNIREYEEKGHHSTINLAALKHVPWCEMNPKEAVKTNALAVNPVTCNYTFVSTDKSVKPINVYGMTKHIGEKVALNNGAKVVRLGNIIGSRGSVLPMAEKQAKQEGKVYLTHPDMERYFIDAEEAARFVYHIATEKSVSGVYIPKDMRKRRIKPMLMEIAQLHDAELEIIGKRAGEKLKEDLEWPEEEVNYVDIPGKDEVFTKDFGLYGKTQEVDINE